MNTVGRTQNEEAYLQVLRKTEETRRMVLTIMANQHLDAFVYPSADHYPARIAPDIMTNPDVVGTNGSTPPAHDDTTAGGCAQSTVGAI